MATDEQLMGESAPERWATPEAGLSAVRVTAEGAEGVPLMLEPKGGLPCTHSTVKISVHR